MCPTRALSLNDDDTLEVDNQSCVRCMHCINVMNKVLVLATTAAHDFRIGGSSLRASATSWARWWFRSST